MADAGDMRLRGMSPRSRFWLVWSSSGEMNRMDRVLGMGGYKVPI